MKRNISVSKDKRTGNYIAYLKLPGENRKSYSTKIRDKKKAEVEAHLEYERRLGKQATLHRDNSKGTVEILFGCFDKIAGLGKPIDICDSAKRDAKNSLMLMLNASYTFERPAPCHGLSDKAKAKLLKLKLTKIDEQLFDDYSEFCLEGVERGPAEQSRRRSINSRLAKVRQLFQPKALKRYAKLGLDIPQSVREFLDTEKIKQVKVQYKAPAESLIQKTWDRMMVLMTERPLIFACFIFAACGGFRKGEVKQMRWSWIREDFSGVDIPEGLTKNSKARFVPLPADRVEWIVANLRDKSVWYDRRDPGMVVGSESCNYLNAELRKLGWNGQKVMHELRKYYGAQVATLAGLFVASHLLGHSGIKVTQSHYSDYLQDMKAAPIVDRIKTSDIKQLEQNTAIEVEAVA